MSKWLERNAAIATRNVEMNGESTPGRAGVALSTGRDCERGHDRPTMGCPPGTYPRVHSLTQLVILDLLLICAPLGCTLASTTPSPVHVLHTEGTLHGFLILKDTKGSVLAHGDLVQTVDGPTVTSTMMFEFPDGSHFEEQVAFTQGDVFRMRRYSLIARGPAFRKQWRISLDADAGRYRVETRAHGEDNGDALEGDITVPADVYNGMLAIIAKNLTKEPRSRVRFVVFRPKPRVVELELTSPDAEQVMLGYTPRQALHFVIKPKLGLLLGAVTSLLGETPPDSSVWIVTHGVPGFVRSAAPLIPDGPVWQIELAAPRWPDAGNPAGSE